MNQNINDHQTDLVLQPNPQAAQILWIGFTIVMVVVSATLAYLTATLVNYVFPSTITYFPLLIIGLSIIIGLIIVLLTLWRGYREVPQNEEWVIELYGKYMTTWTAGAHFIFPFGFMKLRRDVYMGDIKIDLFPDVTDLVDFVDFSAHLKAHAIFRVKDTLRAVYRIMDVEAGVAGRLEALVRSYAGGLTLDQANKDKGQFNLDNLLNKKNDAGHNDDNPLHDDLWLNWGVEILLVAVSDIELSAADIALRRQPLEAKQKLEADKLESKGVVIKAKAHKESLSLEGQGLADQIAKMKAAGLNDQQIANLMRDKVKWENLVKSKDVQILLNDGGDSTTSQGMKFGMGFHHGQKNFNKHGNKDHNHNNQKK